MTLLETFYEELSLIISHPFGIGGDVSARSFIMNTTSHSLTRQKGLKTESHDGFGETRRHVERLLLRLDFSGGFSQPQSTMVDTGNIGEILRDGGLV
jgi:gamma-tubulin complex component 4